MIEGFLVRNDFTHIIHNNKFSNTILLLGSKKPIMRLRGNNQVY